MRRSDNQVRGAGLLVLFTGLLCAPLTVIAQAAPRGTPVEIVRAPSINLGVDAGDPNLEFDRVVSPFLMPDGRLVVPTRGDKSIRVFRANGQLVTRHGRSGAGPGEFGYITSAWARGDTIEVLDGQRITRFLPNGTVATVTLQSKMRDLSWGGGPVSDGWLAGGVESGDMGRRDELVLRRFNRAGADLGEVARVQGFARYMSESTRMGGPEPLSPWPVLELRNGRGYIAETMTPRIQVVNSVGQPEREYRWQPDRPIPVRDALRAVIDSAVARAKPEQAAQIRRRWEDAPVPQQLSVFARFIVDDLGFVWVRPFDPLIHAMALGGLMRTGPGGTWTILSAEGARVGTVRVPADLEPMQITANAVVGIAKDEFGVESVRVHELKRR